MTAPNSLRTLAAGLVLALSTTAAFAAAPAPTPFTATYQVSQGGQVIGEAVITLKSAGNGQWVYSNQTKGTAGIAAALGANSAETTKFRWNNDAPETISYDYNMDAGFKKKQRHTEVNWTSGQVTVDEGKGPASYPSAPGLVDRNTTSFAVGLALRAGKQSVSLPVAVKRNVETQEFKVTGKDTVKVPAGSFPTERVVRGGDEKAFSAWYAPQRYPVPVKLTQSDGGNLELQLVSFKGGN